MPGSEKKSPVLSEKMTELKLDIQDKIRKQEEHQEELNEKGSFVDRVANFFRQNFNQETVHKNSRFADFVSGTIANIIGLIAAIPTAVAEIPVIGFAVKMFAVLPGAVNTLTDSQKSIGERAIALGTLAGVVALSIAAFTIVTVATGVSIGVAIVQASIIGTALSAFMTAMETYKLIFLSIEKNKAKTALEDKKEFEEAVGRKVMPEGNKFDDQLEIRAVELQRKKSTSGLTSDEQQEAEDKLKFVESVLLTKGITVGANEEGSAYKLQELYKKRDQKLMDIAPLIKDIQSAPEGSDLTDTFEKMRALQEEIVTIDDEIDEITQPLEKVTRRDLVADENIAESVTTLSMAVVGLILSVAGYLVAAGTFATIVGPVLSGFGIGMAGLSLVTGMAFKYAEHEDIKTAEQKMEKQKDNILDEALDYYEKNQAQKSLGLSTAQILNGLGGTQASLVSTPALATPDSSPAPVANNTVEPTVVAEKKSDGSIEVSSSPSLI